MKRYNDFSIETRFIFTVDNNYACWGCGRNHANCLHHIFGRGGKKGPEGSPLNAAPMGNFECHLPRHGYWTTAVGRRELFNKTLQYLFGRGYKLTPEDDEFLEKYSEEINRFKINL